MITILHILCEGSTEELFTKNILQPHLSTFDIVTKPSILVTNRKKNMRGGVISYAQVLNDLRKTYQLTSHSNSEIHYFTTMLDFYALPNDFPAYSNAITKNDIYLQVETLEKAFRQDANDIPHFIPYIQLHEFEALVFCGLDHLKNEYTTCSREIEQLKEVLAHYQNNPEAIDNGRETAPSKRIITALKGKSQYNKTKSGPAVASAIGLQALRERCRHFNHWITELEQLSPQSPSARR